MSPSKNRVVIELCGLPGAGKTTLARRLAQDLGAEVIAGRVGRIEMLRAPLFAPILFIRWALRLLSETMATNTYGLLRYKVALLFNTFALIHKAERSSAPLLIIEEGLLQRFLSISERAVGIHDVRDFLGNALTAHRVVFVELQTPTFKRFVSGHARYDRGEGYLAAWKEAVRVNYESIKAALHSKGGDHVTLTNEEDIRAFIAHYESIQPHI